MSSKKEKLIEEAQRLALRGQLDKAIKAYEQVLSLDASSINQRQKLAELLVKVGRLDDARAEFVVIGKHYSSNGFYLKAIAVYKQLQKLFPADLDISLTLANLNEKHGLVGNALAEYKHVYDFYEKIGSMEDALKILEKMQNVDPQNMNIQLKLAESHFNVGKKNESYAAFGRLASSLQQRGDTVAFSKLASRIQQLFPEKTEFILEVLHEQVESGNVAGAVTGIQSLLRTDPNDKRIWELIITAYQKLKQPQRVKIAYQHYLKFFPTEISAIKGSIECLVAEKDVNKALDLLKLNEQQFVKSGAATDLVEMYSALEQLDPINLRVLEGLKSAYEKIGDKAGAEALEQKCASLTLISRKDKEPQQKHQPEVDQDDFSNFESVSFASIESVMDDAPTNEAAEPVLPDEKSIEEPEVFPEISDSFLEPDDEEIEIEIEIDEDLNCFGSLEPEVNASADENWLDSVGEIFETIATSPRGVKFGSDLETSDAQSHYDLGVAFKEMGLFDEAINEFRQASVDPARTVECLVLQGVCLREKGDVVTAENYLRSLVKPGLNIEDTCAIKYELALTCEALGKKDVATVLLTEIDASNPGFRDVSSRLDAAEEENSLDFSEEDLQGFDLK
ncbi:MAG TPA: tetratricopeptide repeat protein [Desulfuromonadaceae bacterium]